MRSIIQIFKSKHLKAYLSAISAYMGVYIVICIIGYGISKIPVIGSFLFYPYYGYSEIGYQGYIFPPLFATIASYRVIFLFKNINYGRIIITTAVTIIIIGLLNFFFPFRPEADRFLSVLFILSGIVFWCLIDLVPTLKRNFFPGKRSNKKEKSGHAPQRQEKKQPQSRKRILAQRIFKWCYYWFFLLLLLIIWLALWVVDLFGK